MTATMRPSWNELLDMPLVMAAAVLVRLPKLDDGTGRILQSIFVPQK